ncbi:hypothetical protein ZIOFF_031961 [Zingiber officinale]|uniref:Uncharacterized protein n=1 Tax=Zingiber officinale TaxID=94328 RepID=A0A8J5GUP4_ZINOF|nr:hypothetical protein ZIOFF_031961 [Zingiber officinale]
MRGRRKSLKTENTNEEDKAESNCCNNVGRFRFVPGPDFTLESFERYVDEFKRQYFSKSAEFVLGSCHQEPSDDDIEGEYWQIVERPTEEIEVLYGADFDTRFSLVAFSKSDPLRSDSNFAIVSCSYSDDGQKPKHSSSNNGTSLL